MQEHNFDVYDNYHQVVEENQNLKRLVDALATDLRVAREEAARLRERLIELEAI